MSTSGAPLPSTAAPATLTTAPAADWVTAARIYHGLVALIGTASLGVSLGISATDPEGGGTLNGIVFTLSYFTVWSNIFALVVNWALAANPRRDGVLFRWLRLTSLVMIVITGLVFDIVLAPLAHPTGLGVYTNIGFHYIVPWATLLGFLVFGPRPRFTPGLVPAMLVIPVAWLGYTLVRGLFLVRPPADPPETTVLGESQHWYPYPFIDVDDPSSLIGVKLEGYGQVMVNVVVILIVGLVLAAVFLWLDRLLSAGQRPTPLTRTSRAKQAIAK